MRGPHTSGEPTPAQTAPTAQNHDGSLEVVLPVRVGDKLLYDITAQLARAATDLGPGNLVKSSLFSLHEAVGAIEVMNPRMDTGYLQDDENNTDVEFDIDTPLNASQVLGVMDELLCLEMAWHQGHPLLQTLFTSVHLDRLLSFEAGKIEEMHFSEKQALLWKHRTERKTRTDPLAMVAICLRAYCMGVIASCQNVINTVTSGNPIFYEDEDISTNTFGRDMLSRFQSVEYYNEILVMLDEATIFFTSLTPAEKTKAGITEDIGHAIVHRLGCRSHFQDMTLYEPAISSFTEWTEDGDKYINQMLKSQNVSQWTSNAFTDKIQRRLASTQPPRPTVKPTFVDAVGQLKRMFKDCEDANEIHELCSNHQSDDAKVFGYPWEVEAFINAFMSRKPEPLPWVRSRLQAMVIKGIGNDDMTSWQRFLALDLSQTVLPGLMGVDAERELLSPVDALSLPLWQAVEAFGQKAIPAQYGFADYFRILCQNRCRVRRLLVHHVKFLDTLRASEPQRLPQTDGPIAAILGQNPFYFWIEMRKLRSLECIIRLGFEQDIYDANELEGMYRALAQVTSDATTHCDVLAHFLDQWIDTNDEDGLMSDNFETVDSGGRYLRASINRSNLLATNMVHLHRCYRVLDLAHPRTVTNSSAHYQLRFKHLKEVEGLEKLLGAMSLGSDSPDTNITRVIAEATREYKASQEQWNPLRRRVEEYMGSLDSMVLRKWQADVFVRKGLRVLVEIGLAEATLHKLWVQGLLPDYHLVYPTVEDRTLAEWMVPRLELKTPKQQKTAGPETKTEQK